MPRKKATAKPRPSTKKPTVEQVANALDRHERVCEQNGRRNFRRLDSIESDINLPIKDLADSWYCYRSIIFPSD